MKRLQRIIFAGLLALAGIGAATTALYARTSAQTGTVTVKRELTLKTSSAGASAGAWIITVTCGRESFRLTFSDYIKLGYYDAVHEAEERGAKVTFGGSTKRELIGGVETYTDVLSQETSYQGDCPRPK